MPELPEVETVRRRLEPYLTGRTLTEVEILDYRLTAPEPPEAVAARLTGMRVEAVGRRGKYLLLELGDGAALTVHLRMTGNLLWLQAPPEHDPPFLRARAQLDDGSYLAYTDIRRFGTWLVAEDGAEALLAGKLGPEPLGDWTSADLARALAGRKAAVKAALLDQRVVAGVGNIYADEALWAARVHPAAPAGRLSRARVVRVHDAVRASLQAGIDAQGASIRDFRTPDGGYGSAQERFAAYGRGGEPCERCGTPLRRTVIAQRGTTYCPRCQRV
ncbi:MAG TPA: bifunctional DNA-formamidopyrimidine glycosylase/DNA-(apurinic or apyrimidinic site) lyase [Gaiellales bacterium]|nr:bifunctional DNA-formamidopyrimidine glycosylase/DNA-(apurinic or apyrimidinic site) lyase [Gaiellales bacterium]